MKTFPMFLRMEDRTVVIVGGGEQAAQKSRLILKTSARLVLCAPELDPELADLVADGKAQHDPAPVTAARFDGAALAFIATGCPGMDAALADLARAARVPVNVVDQPDLCDAYTPSLVDRDPVVVAIGTEGTAPVLARQIKSRIETMLEPQLGGFAALAGRLRGAVARSVPRENRRAFWRWAFADAPRRLHADGAEREAARLLKAAIAEGGAPDDTRTGAIALVGAGPGAADLLTLRALRKLQEADVIFYDRLVDPAVLELARRDAERVFVGKAVGACAWPQDRINAVIVAAALQGRNVVRLKGGDPSMFGRAEEELAAARAAGVSVDIVPGVTAASAAAASLGRSLSERGVSDRVIFATATGVGGGAVQSLGDLARPGTALAIYMGAAKAPAIAADLLDLGLGSDHRVDIVCNASTPHETRLSPTLSDLSEGCFSDRITNPAVILVTVPKDARPHAALPLVRVGAVA
ncbi:MAG: uroporphyrinogen-III C-methyltransferase [Rhodobacteraceae bacterium]|nr:uroporphyrinogen-III C-methyltransferase [Paracoccaceae bacterium]